MKPMAAELKKDYMFLNMGPSHPAMHGTVKILLTLDGERVVDADIEIGYLHRAFEKMCENSTYTQVIPYTDRLNYASPLLNNVGYALAVEKLLGVEVTPRCKHIRVIISEMARVCDHLTCIAANAGELGAFTVLFYLVRARDVMWAIIEKLTGARLTTTYTRIGGLAHDLYDGFDADMKAGLKQVRALVSDVDKLLTRNRIFFDRMRGTGVISAADAVSYGMTGPCLRATGVEYDVRKKNPYLVYADMDFEIPTGLRGDNYDRYLVRLEELRQSMRIIEQAISRLPGGPVNVDDPRVMLPPKKDVYGSIEGVMNHFKLIMEGIRVPKGEAYMPIEGGNGELGFYIVADGTGKPYKCRVRPPSFANVQAMKQMITGGMLADIIATFGTINLIGGENDR
jgi:NADH-quinone oxidoreductase subunit D